MLHSLESISVNEKIESICLALVQTYNKKEEKIKTLISSNNSFQEKLNELNFAIETFKIQVEEKEKLIVQVSEEKKLLLEEKENLSKGLEALQQKTVGLEEEIKRLKTEYESNLKQRTQDLEKVN